MQAVRTCVEAGAGRGHGEEGAADIHGVGALGDDYGGGLGKGEGEKEACGMSGQ